MAALKKRPTAILIAVFIVVIGTLFGVHRSVGSETAKIEALFYNGVYMTDERYTQPSIDAQLKKRHTAALGLVSVANNYSDLKELTNTLSQARLALNDAATIPAKYAANEKMQAAYKNLYASLVQHTLKDNEKASSGSYAETLNGAQGVIEQSDYNRMVSDFRNSTLGVFPVNILKNMAFAHYPDYFGQEGSN